MPEWRVSQTLSAGQSTGFTVMTSRKMVLQALLTWWSSKKWTKQKQTTKPRTNFIRCLIMLSWHKGNLQTVWKIYCIFLVLWTITSDLDTWRYGNPYCLCGISIPHRIEHILLKNYCIFNRSGGYQNKVCLSISSVLESILCEKVMDTSWNYYTVIEE